MWTWLKKHKLVVVLLAVIVYLLWVRQIGVPGLTGKGIGGSVVGTVVRQGAPLLTTDEIGSLKSVGLPSPITEAPPSDRTDRLVIEETTLSLVVKDVPQAIERIKSQAVQLGGYLVNSYLSRPQENASGTIVVRVPREKQDEALAAFKAAGLRVVDEQVTGLDVTDEYEDLGAKRQTLAKTKAKLEQIMDQATRVQDILEVQQNIITIQSQIDQLVGRQQFLAGSARTSRVTVYVSTDEFSLPYAPAEPWRPQVVFKLAVRSLVVNLRRIGTAAIWAGVYSPLWAPVIGGFWWWTRRNPSRRV